MQPSDRQDGVAANVDGTKRAHGDWDGGNTPEGIDAQNEWLEKVAAEKRAAATTQEQAVKQIIEDVQGDLYLWRIGEITAEQALTAIEEWVRSVEGASSFPDLDEMRAFAAGLTDDLGPMFGRDVVRLIDSYRRLERVLYMTEEESC